MSREHSCRGKTGRSAATRPLDERIDQYQSTAECLKKLAHLLVAALAMIFNQAAQILRMCVCLKQSGSLLAATLSFCACRELRFSSSHPR